MRLLRRPSHTSVVAYLALFVAATGTASAATGGSFLLGKTNAAIHTSVLQNNGPGAALRLTTKHATTPPLSVSGNKTKVSGLNADLLDGLDSAKLQRKVSSACTTAGSISAIRSDGTVRCGPQIYFAVVDADNSGTLARGSNGVTSGRTGTGFDIVDFGRDVTDCADVADIGLSGSIGVGPAAYVATVGANGEPSQIYVSTYNSAGASTNEPFHLIVVCPPADAGF